MVAPRQFAWLTSQVVTLTVLALVTMAAPAAAQVVGGSIGGTVTDDTGDVGAPP